MHPEVVPLGIRIGDVGATDAFDSVEQGLVRRLDESLREADRHASRRASEGRQVAPPAPAGGAGTREARVMRLRKLGFSSAVIADRLATSQGEVELILNLAGDRGPVPHRPDPGTAMAPATRT